MLEFPKPKNLKLAALRLKKNMSVLELAMQLDVSVESIKRTEARSSNLQLYTLRRYIHALGYDFEMYAVNHVTGEKHLLDIPPPDEEPRPRGPKSSIL
jgi:transcriptional regulator with XRE-family HTH domain